MTTSTTKTTSSIIATVTSKEQFDDVLKKQDRVCVDFYAQWCGPCKTIAPDVEHTAKFTPSVAFLKVDVDELDQLTAEYGIQAMPTFLFFYKGQSDASLKVTGANLTAIRASVEALVRKSGS